MVLPVVMYGYERWTVKKPECQIIDAFELWCWRRLLRVAWTARRSNQSILKEINPNIHWKDWCWSWNSNTLATSRKELTHWQRLWCWEGLGAGREGDDRGWDGWMASPTRWTWVWVNSSPGVGDGKGGLACCDSWGHKESDTTERLKWTELNWGWLLPQSQHPRCPCTLFQFLWSLQWTYMYPVFPSRVKMKKEKPEVVVSI